MRSEFLRTGTERPAKPLGIPRCGRGALVCLAGERQGTFLLQEGLSCGVREKAKLMDEAAVGRALMRLSHEIAERNRGVEDVCLVGIRRRGEPLAERIRDNIEKIEGVRVPCGSVDVRFYRDDLERLADDPIVERARLEFAVRDKSVVLVDDVLYTGRTARAAMEAVLSCGRPKAIQLAVLIDRGHRELPIRADYVGKNVPTSHTELIEVRLPEYDGETGVWLMEL